MSIFQIINYLSEGNIRELTSFKYLYKRRNEKVSFGFCRLKQA